MIRAYIGLLGQGKTLNATYDIMELLRKGARVISNTPIQFEEKGNTFYAEYVNNGKEFQRKLKTEENCVFFIDEASIFFPSFFWDKLDGTYIMRFAQARKYRTDIFYTSQGYNHTIKRLRDLTNEVVKCTARKLPILSIPLYVATTYDPEFFAQRIISSPTVEQRYIIRSRILYPSEYRRVYRAYNTMQRVESSALTNIDKPIKQRKVRDDDIDIDD